MKFLVMFICGIMCVTCLASEQENEKLYEAISLLDRIDGVLIDAATLIDDSKPGIRLDYKLARSDVAKIKEGILEKVAKEKVSPRRVEPLSGEYL